MRYREYGPCPRDCEGVIEGAYAIFFCRVCGYQDFEDPEGELVEQPEFLDAA